MPSGRSCVTACCATASPPTSRTLLARGSWSSSGYDVDVVEFVALEHTPKNVLLRATPTSRPAADVAALAAEYRAFVDALGIDPALERMLGDLLPAGARR